MLPQDQFSTAFCEAFGDIELELPHLEQKSPDQSAQRELADFFLDRRAVTAPPPPRFHGLLQREKKKKKLKPQLINQNKKR